MPLIKKPLKTDEIPFLAPEKQIWTGNTGLVKAWNDGDKTHFTHMQQVDAIQQRAQRIRETCNGWTEDREFQMIGTIPETLLLEHPEFLTDEEALYKFLRSEEGSAYRTCKKV